MIIVENFLLLSNTKEFNNRLTIYFYDRLQLFLSIVDRNPPKIIFTTSQKILQKYYGNAKTEGEPSRAFFDDTTDTIVFNADKYYINSNNFIGKKEELNDIINEYSFRYIIPLSDIYHEMIHYLQSYYADYEYTDFIEAVADIYSYCITGQWNIDYLNEAIGFWRICTEILNVKQVEFFVILRDATIDKNFFKEYFYSNEKFVRFLAKNYNGRLSQFLHNFKKDFGNKEYETNFYNYVSRIHNLIFYKY